jgi:hypothetical protein
MVNTVFKGDIAEVSWGKETGFQLNGDGSTTGWVHTTQNANDSVLTIGTGAYFHTGGGTDVEIPDNALVGCILRITGGTTFASDDFATTRRSYYIIANDTTAGTITVQPALATGTGNAGANDVLTIDSIGSPTFDAAMTDASQQVKSDQFMGLLQSFAIPEPEIDVRRQHVIGMGRDVNVLTSGRETLAGGQIVVNAHSLRWLKYALGGVSSLSQGEFAFLSDATTIDTERPLNIKASISATAAIQLQAYGASTTTTATQLSTLALTGSSGVTGNALIGNKGGGSSTTITVATSDVDVVHEVVRASGGIFKTLSAAGAPMFGSYTAFNGSTGLTGCANLIATEDALARAQSSSAVVYVLAPLTAAASIGDVRLKIGSTNRAKFVAGDYVQIVDKDTHQIPGQDSTPPTVNKHEIRRVIAASGDYIYIEEPLMFDHAMDSCGIERIQYLADEKRGSPQIDATTKQLHFPVSHTVFGADHLPTFMIEQSFRQTDATPGGEQLLRLYNGCKVDGARISADSEGELKVEVDYQATRHYTDTGSKFNPHRMFNNTAETATNRKVSGIIVDGEKPYLFQDMSIEVFGQPVLRGTAFEIGLSNNNVVRHYIRGYSGVSADTDQVQNGGTQMPLDITEAQREYTFKFTAIIEDDRMWEQLRTRKHHKNTNDITISLKKRGSNATRESATITVEDYTILKADHQVPDDKGAVMVEIDLAVRHMKIVENSPYFTL